MSLKQRAVQCSGHIPADQYVPVYSRPHRTNQARWHEEISPIAPKPTLDDPYDTRTHSIHAAVKQWLESSPNSVIGPLYRSRSPSSGPSNGESVEKTPARAETPPWESNMERFYDVGSGGLSPKQLSPRQVSIEQSVALVSGSSTSSPKRADRAGSSTPWENAYTDRDQDAAGTPGLPPTQDGEVKSPDRIAPQGDDGKSRKANEASLPSIPQAAVNQVLSREEETSAIQADEGVKVLVSSGRRRGGKKRNIAELTSPDDDRSYGLSGGSLSDFTSRSASREFDNALSLAVKEIDKLSAVDALSCTSGNSSSVGEPVVLLKPPRGLERNMSPPAEQNSTVAKLPSLPRAASAGDDHHSAVMMLVPPLTRAASAREDDQNSMVRRLSPSHRAADTENTSGVLAGGAKPSKNSEIVPIGDPDIDENGFSDKENISEGKQKSLPPDAKEQKKLGFRATLKKIDESRLELGSRTKTSDAPRLTIKAVLQNEANLAAQLEMARSSNLPVISNGVAALPGGGFEFRNERSSRRTQSSYSSGGSVASAANSVPSQYIYRVSPPHDMARKVNRLKKQSANAVAPVESHQLKGDKVTKSSKYTERETNRKAREELEKAKLEELRLKADAWESAKNATILNRYKREESKIHAWEERKLAKAAVNLSKFESDLEKKKAKATEKMQLEVAQAHKKAAEMKAQAEAKRAERAAKAAVQAQVIRVIGKFPLSCFRS